MNILALQGSPRLGGNTQAVLDIVIAAAEEAGAHTETIQLANLKNLTGCRECYACQQKPDEPGCAIKDDMQAVFGKMLEAELVIWAMPVFCWAPTWLAKMAMDRLFCMFKFQDGGDVNSLLAGRKMAAVITAGGGADDGADLVTETCRRIAEYSKTHWLGALTAANVDSPETIRADKDLVERAGAFGKQLAS